MKENVIQVKSYAFSLKIIEAFKYLQYDKKEYVLIRQVLRSGTSIGANVEEAIGGQSRKDFFAKLTISYKEARETKYWIRLLRDSNYLPQALSLDLLSDVDEILRIIGSIQKTMKNT